jgi:hypothetical protein
MAAALLTVPWPSAPSAIGSETARAVPARADDLPGVE